tara:strand:+ start:108 stop:386 length:279 start_codon:yes stop_codon:yes gene_type:complete
MALNFENVYQDADFLPSPDELTRYKSKLEIHEEFIPKKRRAIYPDEYDDLGRNVTEQERRQNKVPWIRVKYHNGKIYVDPDKKEILRSMLLI